MKLISVIRKSDRYVMSDYYFWRRTKSLSNKLTNTIICSLNSKTNIKHSGNNIIYQLSC